MTALKIRSLELHNFRGFRHAAVNCDADVVLVYGRNGVGKTTIFDAIEYALFGCNRRLEALDEAWQQHLANVYGEGSFSIGLQFQSGDRIDVTRHRDGEVDGVWAGHATIRDFIYERLMKNRTLGRRNVAAIHDLSLATHLLLQSEIAKLAASGTLDSEKLAALTGSGYLERCRDKAAQAQVQLRRRRQDASVRHSNTESLRQQALTQVRRATELLTHRDELVDKLRQQAVRPVFAPEILDRVDERSVAGELAAVSGRLRDSLREAERTLVLARGLLEAPAEVLNDVAIRAAVDALNDERLRTMTARNDLVEQVDVARMTFDKHESDHSRLAARRDVVATVVRDVAALHHDLARLPGVVEASSAAGAALVQAEAALKAAESESTGAAAGLAESRSQETRLQSRAAHLREAYERRARAEQACDQLDVLLRNAEERLASARTAAESATRLSEQATQVFEREQQVFARSASEIDALIGELRSLISAEPHCPLCGTPFGTATALRRAIDIHAMRRSEEHAIAQRRMEEQRRLRDEAVEVERAALNALDATVARANDEREQRGRAFSSLNTATAQLAALVPTDADAAKLIRSTATQIEFAAKVVADKLRAATEAESHLAKARDIERSARLRVRAAADGLRALEDEIEGLKARVVAAARNHGISTDETSLREMLGSLDVALRDSGERRDVLVRQVRDLESRLKELVRRLTDAEARLSAEQQRLQDVATRRDARQRQLATVGLPPDVKREDLAAAVSTASRMVEKLRMLADGTEELARIASSATAADLQNAQAELHAVELRKQSAERELETIDVAQQTLRSWEEALRRRVDSAVRAFVIPREAEIDDTFRSLIADPFRFDRVAIQHDSAVGLQLGLVFRSLAKPSGSPEWFLRDGARITSQNKARV